jgi:hypothetical protein
VYSLDYTDIPKAFFTPNHVCRSCINVIRGHCWATVCSNNIRRSYLHWCDPRSLLLYSVFQQWPRFPLLLNSVFQLWYHSSHRYATMVLVRRVAYFLGKQRSKDRQTWMGPAHARAWRTPNNQTFYNRPLPLFLFLDVLFPFVRANMVLNCFTSS